MTPTLKTVAAISAAIAAALALPAIAAQPLAATDDLGMVVVRDADTGKLRAPTAAEHEELTRGNAAQQRNARAAGPKALAPRSHQSGARGTRMHDELLHHSVMVRNADGSSSMMCVDPDGAIHALHAEQVQNKTAAAIPRVATKLETE